MTIEEIRSAAKEIVATIRKQNWKNGGVLEVDVDVAEGMVENAIYRAHQAGRAYERDLQRHKCPACGGDGVIVDYERDEYDRGVGLTHDPCGKCKGTGIYKPVTP